jgi:WD40 repeat protein
MIAAIQAFMSDRSLEFNNRQILIRAIAPNTQTIASTDIYPEATAPRIQLWDISQNSFRFLSEIEDTHAEVTKIAFSADSNTLAIGNFYGTITLREVKNGQLIDTLDAGSCINDIAFSLNSQYLLSATDYAGTRLWNLKSRQKVDCFSGFEGWTYAVAFSRNGEFAAAGDDCGCIQIRRIRDGMLLNTLNHSCVRGFLAFSYHDLIIASANNNDGTIKLWWWLEEQEPIPLCLEHGKTGIWAIAFHPHKLILASAATDGSVILWDLDRDSELHYQHEGKVNILQFSSDGRQLYICNTLGCVKIWDL